MKHRKKEISYKRQLWSMVTGVLFWLFVWQLLSVAIDEILFLPSPLQALQALLSVGKTDLFWRSVFTSLWRIGLGFVLGLGLGVLLGWASSASVLASALLRPLMQLVRATPVASFIILTLLWVSSQNLSVFISFLMVLPIVYSGTLTGIQAADAELLEMADVFKVGLWRRIRAIYLPALQPALLNASELALGICWKSGVAAEVIGLPEGTIGERLYQAKIFLQTPELFAWTFVIIVLSWLFGKAVLWALRVLAARLAALGMAEPKQRQALPAVSGEGSAASASIQAAETFFSQPLQPMGILLDNINKCYGNQQVLQQFSMQIAPGEAVALMGDSGRGKTTLLRLVTGLEKPDSGSVQRENGAKFCYVFQEDRLCPALSAIGNVALVLPHADAEAIGQHLAAVGLTQEDIHKPSSALSGGQKRRVALVRAVMASGGALVLDEAFKGLDDAVRKKAYTYVNHYRKGRTLLMVTHDVQEAEALADRRLQLTSP